MNDKELMHYGVLGMRWGVRHDKEYRSGLKSLKSKGLSKDKFKKEKAALRLKTANRLYSQNSSAANDRIVNRSTRGTIALTSMLGSYGTMKYDQARAKGNGNAKAAVKGMLGQWGDHLTGGLLGLSEYWDNRESRKK